ncbi:MAG TPA: protein-L-isoaspartate(D-aspartate) O-methyltransferase [Afifellaceae bacterium]|nr:protein-L-isoaspartate(D-aspartate) O-methyltransferase [Afifellaceae bacterium]
MRAEPATAHPEVPGYEEDEATRVQAASLILRLRSQGIFDRFVLKAIESVPRTLFVPAECRAYAYADKALPIACGQLISAPSVVGMMTAALDLCDRHSVLEIGTGSGYQSAVLARLARRVTTMDRFRTLIRAAEARWQALGIRNISALVGDGFVGWKRQAPFDRILVTAAVPNPPIKLIAQLTDSGILVAPVGAAGTQRLILFQRIGHNVDTRDLGTVRFLPMVAGIALSL